MTFDELFKEHSLTAEERSALVVFLATHRARRTIEVLNTPAKPEAPQPPKHRPDARRRVREALADWQDAPAQPVISGSDVPEHATESTGTPGAIDAAIAKEKQA